MARIEIDDLSEDEEISAEEMQKVMGGYSLDTSGGTTFARPKETFFTDSVFSPSGSRFGSGDTFCG